MNPACDLEACEAVVSEKDFLCLQFKLVNYCSKEHKEADLDRHKPECAAASVDLVPDEDWSLLREVADLSLLSLSLCYESRFESALKEHLLGLSPAIQKEWLVDCYRLRLADERYWQYRNRPGSLYDQSGAQDILQDFLVFCCLAKRRGVFPDDWNWSEFLVVAARLLAFKLNYKDAMAKYEKVTKKKGMTKKGSKGKGDKGSWSIDEPLQTHDSINLG